MSTKRKSDHKIMRYREPEAGKHSSKEDRNRPPSLDDGVRILADHLWPRASESTGGRRPDALSRDPDGQPIFSAGSMRLTVN